MNYVMISPHFPPNYRLFAVRMKEMGINVLGIGSEPYDKLNPELKDALTEYYFVNDMEDYSQMLKACAFFTFKYGKIDRLESQNEYWLEQDARLRTDFNIFGFKTNDMKEVKYKSKMKEAFRKQGLKPARGKVMDKKDEVLSFIKECGYPIVVKPDNGVGASDTHKIKNREDLDKFFENKRQVSYIFEEFVSGQIETFDGLVDKEGKLVFASSLVYHDGIMDILNEGLETCFYVNKEIGDDLREVGMKALKSFDLRERFFHIEFFRTQDNKLIPLEINVRPPGGIAIDFMNYAFDSDLYRVYAQIVAGAVIEEEIKPKYYCMYVGLHYRDGVEFEHSLDEIFEKYGSSIVYQGLVEQVFSGAMGNYALGIRSDELGILEEATEFIIKKKSK